MDELTQIESRLNAALTCINNAEESIEENDYDNALIMARSAEEKIEAALYYIRNTHLTIAQSPDQITHKEDTQCH